MLHVDRVEVGSIILITKCNFKVIGMNRRFRHIGILSCRGIARQLGFRLVGLYVQFLKEGVIHRRCMLPKLRQIFAPLLVASPSSS